MSELQSSDPFSVLASKIGGIPVAMLTTIGDDSRLHSRPMLTHEATSESGLWFYTSTDTPVAQNIVRRSVVNLSYVDLVAQRFVSVVGRARLIRDTDRALEMWTPAVAAWFPKGVNDQNLTFVHVDVDEADYWDVSVGRFVRLSGFIRGLIGDIPPQPEIERGHLDMHTT